MTDSPASHRAVYGSSPIPNLLAVVSNIRKAPNYPLVSKFQPISDVTKDIEESRISIGYFVSRDASSTRRLLGKQYSRVSDTATRIETPIGHWGRLSVVFDYQADCPTITVNPTYHRVARITIGNVHSVGWLLRDLTNICLLLNNICLLHAAALQHDDRATILIGLSNTGKTTTVLELSKRHAVNFYGDDLIAVEGDTLYSCPLTMANVEPRMFGTKSQQVSHWARRNIPFYENFGPIQAPVSITDFLGSSKVASPAKVTEILFLKHGRKKEVVDLTSSEAGRLLLASNRTEFTYPSSPVFCSADYLQSMQLTDRAEANERWALSNLAESCSCKLVTGGQADFRRETEISLKLDSDS